MTVTAESILPLRGHLGIGVNGTQNANSHRSMLLTARQLKPLWVPIDDAAAQLFPNFQSQWSKPLKVVILKVVKLSPAKAVFFLVQ